MTNHPTRSTGAPASRVVAFAAMLTVVLAIVAGPARAQTASPTPAATPSSKAGSGRIGVATLGPTGLPADLRIKLEDAAAAGLRASGAEVVSGIELSRARTAATLGACTDAVCEQRLAQVTDTRYWLRGNIVLDTSTYRIHLELTDARSGTVLAARDDTCDICTEADAVEAVNMAASTLKAKADRSSFALVAPPPSGGPGAAALSGVTDGIPAPTGVEHAGSGRPTWLRVLPWVAFAGAAAALAAGAYYWSMDGDPDPDHCHNDVTPPACNQLKDGSPRMYIYAGVGAALAATGVVLLVIPGPSATAAGDPGAPAAGSATTAARTLGVGVSARGLTLSGRF